MNTAFAAPYDLSKETLALRRNAKWSRYAPDILPAFVAEMDYAIAPAIQQAIERSVHEQRYGYPGGSPGSASMAVAEAFSSRMASLFAWEPDPSNAIVVADLVQGSFATVMAFSEPGEDVVLQVPAYPPFFDAIATTGRRLASWHLNRQGDVFEHDFDELADFPETAKILVLCNPHNPTGRVLRRDELEKIAAVALQRDMIVISDEIHADIVYPGHRHIPFASLGPDIAARTVTLNSATKSFNIPGLRCAVIHFGTRALKERFHQRLPAKLFGACTGISMDATVAAWTESQDWLAGAMKHLTAARNQVMEFCRAEFPQINIVAPEGTYFGWLDCSALPFNDSAYDFFFNQAKVAMSAGETFLPGAERHVRLNFATSPAILEEILGRMGHAIKGLHGR